MLLAAIFRGLVFLDIDKQCFDVVSVASGLLQQYDKRMNLFVD